MRLLTVLLAVFLPITPDSFAAELAGLGLSVNSRERALHFLDSGSGKVTRTVSTPLRADGAGKDAVNLGMAFGGGHFWVLGFSVNQGARPLYKISPSDGSIAQTLITDFRPDGFGKDLAKLSLTFGDGFLWGLSEQSINGRRSIYKISPTNGAVMKTIGMELAPTGLYRDYAELGVAYGEGHLWFLGDSALNKGRPLYKVNVQDGKFGAAIITPFRTPDTDAANLGMAFGDGHLWVFGNSINNRARHVYQVNPVDGVLVKTIPSTFGPANTDMAPLGLVFVSR